LNLLCHLCNKRKAERFCPAVGAKICAICCGTEREVTLDCPSDCPWLIAARRYEENHRRSSPPREISFPDVDVPRDFVLEHEEALGRLMAFLGEFAAANPALRDSECVDALKALAETRRTLQSGIYYERPPALPLARALYDHLAKFIADLPQQPSATSGAQPLKDSQIVALLVLQIRLAELSTNGRPRSRAFLDYLRQHFLGPASPSASSADPRANTHTSPANPPRIILP
jgi:hypothetical protein